MHLDLAVLVITCLVSMALGLFVLVRSRSAGAWPFVIMAVCICAWSMANYLTNQHFSTVGSNNITNRLAFAAGYGIVLSGYIFSTKFPVSRDIGRRGIRRLVVLSSLVIGLSGTPLIAGQVTQSGSHLYFSVGPLVVLYVLAFLGLIVLVVRNMLSFRAENKLQRAQAKLVLTAFSVTATMGLVVNLIIPSIASNWLSTQFSPLVAVVFIGIITYSIFKHQLFDIRLALARSTAYFLAIGTIASGYFIVIVLVSHIIMHDTHLVLRAQLLNVAIAVFVGLTYSPMKHFFDRVTDRIFFRDNYDTKQLLDQLNSLFVSTTDLEHLLEQTIHILTVTFKAEHCYFSIHTDNQSESRIVGHAPKHFREEDMHRFQQLIPHLKGRLVVTNNLPKDQAAMRQLLESYDTEVLGRLVSNVNHHGDGLGYLVLGPRRTGNLYTQRDIQTLETIVGELFIAIENALRFEQIQHFNETLQANVSDATRKLRSTNDKLQQLDATKDEFITMASHQLRTPLTSVKGYLSMVLEGDAGKLNKQQTELLTQSYVSSQRMVYLISDLLNLSRLNTGRFVIASVPTDLRNVVQAEIDQLRETAKSREITLLYDNPAAFPVLMLDTTKIHQVVMNFIDNAIYYTPAGGKITVSLRETPTAVEYTVKDNGIGVPKAEQHKLFTKFYRAGNARKARPDGTGLGLFMAKKVIVAQGGAIVFTSEEGKGSTFGFRFSKAHHLAPAVTPAGSSSKP